MPNWCLSEREKNAVLDALAKYNTIVELLADGDYTKPVQLSERVQTSTLSDPTAQAVGWLEKSRRYKGWIDHIVEDLLPTERELVKRKFMNRTPWPSDKEVMREMKIGKQRFYEAKEAALWDLKCELVTAKVPVMQ